jgi:hypothetical protein
MDEARCLSVKGALKGARPKQGDVSLCLGCGEILTYDKTLNLRGAELKDLIGLSRVNNLLLTRAQKLIRDTRPLANRKS